MLIFSVFISKYQWSIIYHSPLGEFEDVNCYNEAQPHAMLLVGYTETIMRVRNRLVKFKI